MQFKQFSVSLMLWPRMSGLVHVQQAQVAEVGFQAARCQVDSHPEHTSELLVADAAPELGV